MKRSWESRLPAVVYNFHQYMEVHLHLKDRFSHVGAIQPLAELITARASTFSFSASWNPCS